MPTLFVLGRVAFAMIFILSGALKLTSIDATGAMIASKVVLPQFLDVWALQLADATGKTIPQLMAIILGGVEVAAGIMIAVNVGTRFAAFLLILFTVITTLYFYDLAGALGDLRSDNTIQIMRNISTLGALLIFFVLGSWRPIPLRQDDPDNPQMRY